MSSFAASLILGIVIGLVSHANCTMQPGDADTDLNVVTQIVSQCFSEQELSFGQPLERDFVSFIVSFILGLTDFCRVPDRVKIAIHCSYTRTERYLQRIQDAQQATGKRRTEDLVRLFHITVPGPDGLSDLFSKACDIIYDRVDLDLCPVDDNVLELNLRYLKCVVDGIFNRLANVAGFSADIESAVCGVWSDIRGCMKDFVRSCPTKTSDWILTLVYDVSPRVCKAVDPEILHDEI